MTQKLAPVCANTAVRTNRFYAKSEKLRALLSFGGAKRILFSGKADWMDAIERGFRRLPHQVHFGSINEESFQRYDIVVPLSLAALEEARRYSPPKKIALPLPSAESVRLCNDKYEFNQAVTKAGFEQHIPKMAQGVALTPPYILKKRVGVWGKECYIIRNRDDEKAQLDRINDANYFCQELVPGTAEFATHILFVGGRIIKALNIRYEFASETCIKGQSAVVSQTIRRCPYLDLFARILRTIRYEGLCCVNYKVANGQPFLLEINPRFGGSLAPYFFSFVRHLR